MREGEKNYSSKFKNGFTCKTPKLLRRYTDGVLMYGVPSKADTRLFAQCQGLNHAGIIILQIYYIKIFCVVYQRSRREIIWKKIIINKYKHKHNINSSVISINEISNSLCNSNTIYEYNIRCVYV